MLIQLGWKDASEKVLYLELNPEQCEGIARYLGENAPSKDGAPF